MAAASLLILHLPKGRDTSAQRIQDTLNKARDWIELNPGTWILWTTSSTKVWRKRIADALGEDQQVFIAAIDGNRRGGRMPTAIWRFIDQKLASAPDQS